MFEQGLAKRFSWIPVFQEKSKKERKMEQRLAKQESKNMDACLRRLKQELVGSVVSSCVVGPLFYFIRVYFEHFYRLYAFYIKYLTIFTFQI